MTDQSPHSPLVLAIARMRAAYERTMMAWIRMATSLITFAFSIYKFSRSRGQLTQGMVVSLVRVDLHFPAGHRRTHIISLGDG